MKKLTLCILAIILLIIPGMTFSQEINNDTIVKEVPDTIQQLTPKVVTKQDVKTKAESVFVIPTWSHIFLI